MIKKIVIAGLIIWGLFLFYKKFVAPTLEPFFKKYTNNVDFFGVNFSRQDYTKMRRYLLDNHLINYYPSFTVDF